MSNLPSQHPSLSIHLTDITLTPLITSSSSQPQLESLTALTSRALTSQATASRTKLGRPQRIVVEYPNRGPVVLQSFLDPKDAALNILEPEQNAQDGEGAAKGGTQSRSRTPPASSSASLRLTSSSANLHSSPQSPSSRSRSRPPSTRGKLKDTSVPSTPKKLSRPTTPKAPAGPTPEESGAPMLVGTVIAPSAEYVREAKKAAVKMEELGRGFQREWAADVGDDSD